MPPLGIVILTFMVLVLLMFISAVLLAMTGAGFVQPALRYTGYLVLAVSATSLSLITARSIAAGRYVKLLNGAIALFVLVLVAVNWHSLSLVGSFYIAGALS